MTDSNASGATAKESPTQARRSRLARLLDAFAAMKSELGPVVEMTNAYDEGFRGAQEAFRELFSNARSHKERDAILDSTVIPATEEIVAAYDAGYLDRDEKQLYGSFGALAALSILLQRHIPPF